MTVRNVVVSADRPFNGSVELKMVLIPIDFERRENDERKRLFSSNYSEKSI